MKRAIVLAGGGAKGAYQAGFMKAINESNWDYQIVTGTSIGALNACLLAQKDIDVLLHLWNTIEEKDVFFNELPDLGGDLETMLDQSHLAISFFKTYVKEKGADITPLKLLIRRLLKEDVLLQSSIDFGLCTVYYPSLKPLYITKAEMPRQHIYDYLLASASCFPLFPIHRFDDHSYIDGGYFDNVPIDLALAMGADEVLVVDLAYPVKHSHYLHRPSIHYTHPQIELHGFMDFSRSSLDRLIRLGYLQGQKAMEKYANGRYMSDFAINDIIQELLQSGQPASVVPKEQLQYVREYITIHRGVISTSELKYMIRIGLLTGQDVLKMYENRKRSLENVLAIQEDLDLKEFLTPACIVEKFNELENLNDEEHAYEIETIKRYLNLYKALYLEGKPEEDLEKAGKELIEELKKSEKEHDERTESRKQEGLLRYGLISERIYAILASKGMIRPEDFMNMYQKDVIRLKTIEQLREDGIYFDNVDIEAYIIDSYMKIRENENSDKTELKKYIALYKVLTLKELSEEEINEKANDLVINIGTRIESDIESGKQIKPFGKEDRKSLYDLEAIPIDTVVLWADKGELIELLKSEFLVPKDMRKLYQQNSIILHDIQEIIESQDVKLEQKIGIINIVFPSPEDAEIREMLFGKITEIDETVVSEKESVHREGKHSGAKAKYRKHIFDTAVRYNSWIQSDENVKMEILNDGHIAVHLPNIREGIVVVEQFYKLKKAKDGKRKMDDAWGVGGYILTEEAYQENKDRFITKDYRVDRQQLGNVVKELAPKLEEKGISGNLYHFQNYPEVVQKLIGIPKGLAKAKTEPEREKAIRMLEDSKQYSSEEMKRIKDISEAWQRVRESRTAYEK